MEGELHYHGQKWGTTWRLMSVEHARWVRKKKLKMASQCGFNKKIYALANLNYFPWRSYTWAHPLQSLNYSNYLCYKFHDYATIAIPEIENVLYWWSRQSYRLNGNMETLPIGVSLSCRCDSSDRSDYMDTSLKRVPEQCIFILCLPVYENVNLPGFATEPIFQPQFRPSVVCLYRGCAHPYFLNEEFTLWSSALYTIGSWVNSFPKSTKYTCFLRSRCLIVQSLQQWYYTVE